MATTKSNPRLLDLTRLTRRVGRPLTGVDRVEMAYLDQLLSIDAPLFGLVRTSLGFVLLDRVGCGLYQSALKSDSFPPPDRVSRLRKLDAGRAGAETYLRRICLDRCVPWRLPKMLSRHVPDGIHYLNTGHSNLTDRVISSLRTRPDTRIGVLVHDTIPLEYPQYQRPETEAKFAGFLTRTIAQADLIICNSHQTERDIARRAAPATPQMITAHLGADVPATGEPPHGPWDSAPYFVCVGTIEPRKNHALLLDIWPEVEDAHLLIIGNRGWNNESVFNRLDAHPPRVHELSNLPDAQMFALMQNSAGLLFPSHAEGYGLPPLEAAALGVPILCNTLPIYHEVLGDIPIYAEVSDGYLWRTTINRMAQDHRAGSPRNTSKPLHLPSWDAHFKTVLSLI